MWRSFWHNGGAWVIAQSVLMSAAIVLGVVFHGGWTNVAVMATGLVLFLAGGVIGLAGVWVLGRNRTPFPRPRDGSEFIQRGIYTHLRHPLYTSVMLASLGWALIWQSGPAFVVSLMLIPFFRAKARREEQWLRTTFPDYAGYARRVPAFLPRFRLRWPGR